MWSRRRSERYTIDPVGIVGCILSRRFTIENAFSKLKALLRKEAARAIDSLLAAIGRLVDVIRPAECANMFAAAGYDPD